MFEDKPREWRAGSYCHICDKPTIKTIKVITEFNLEYQIEICNDCGQQIGELWLLSY